MRAADHMLDIGVHAGELGGNVVYRGRFQRPAKDDDVTHRKIPARRAEIKVPQKRRTIGKRKIEIIGAREHNLKDVSVKIPLDMLVCITGVSGSGKSTLVHDVLYAGLKKKRGEWNAHVGFFKEIKGADLVDDVILVDQSPIGRTPRSNPVTYIKAYDAIREVFAATNAAKTKGFNASHFSFNVPGGRCEICQGSGDSDDRDAVSGRRRADLRRLPRNAISSRRSCDVKYKGRNIHEVLEMTVREAICCSLRTSRRLTSRLKVLDAVGLGYLRLGQSATTLSGGEAQRVKLAAHLAQKTKAKTLFIFDEPTTGLHFDDINKLLAAFRALIDNGGSLVVIEHNIDVIKTADHVIDLGPEGGVGGGEIVATGTPEQVAKNAKSITGRYLKPYVD